MHWRESRFRFSSEPPTSSMKFNIREAQPAQPAPLSGSFDRSERGRSGGAPAQDWGSNIQNGGVLTAPNKLRAQGLRRGSEI